MSIQTVSGIITREKLGVVMPHEHVFIDLSSFFSPKHIPGCSDTSMDCVTIDKIGILSRDPYALRDNLLMTDFETQCAEIACLRDAGGLTIVDMTSIGLARDPHSLLEASRRTGLNIVAGTGFYVGTTHSKVTGSASIQMLCDLMCRELMQGMDDTDIRAGVIGEIGVSEFFSELEHKVLMAAAMAHEKTGQAISVHINPWTTHGVEAAKLLLKANVPPEKICICHVDVENRRPYIQELLDLGVFIEFDNFGKEYFVQRSARRFGYGTFVTDIQRVVLLRELVDKGYEHQILLSCDVCLKTLLHAYGGWGYDHLLRNILPMAIEEGISQKQLDVMIVDNPGRFLDTND